MIPLNMGRQNRADPKKEDECETGGWKVLHKQTDPEKQIDKEPVQKRIKNRRFVMSAGQQGAFVYQSRNVYERYASRC